MECGYEETGEENREIGRSNLNKKAEMTLCIYILVTFYSLLKETNKSYA